MQTTVFESRPLPATLAARLRGRMGAAHAARPFSTTDARATIRRVGDLLDDLAVRSTVYRGGLDLRGAEVDHLWLAVEVVDVGEDRGTHPGGLVLDIAFPLFDDGFVTVLRRFVAGDATADELESAGARADLDARVLGDFPRTMRYLGRPIWSPR